MLLRPPALGPSPDVVALPPAPDKLEVITVSAGRSVTGGGGTGHSWARASRACVHGKAVVLRYQIEIFCDSQSHVGNGGGVEEEGGGRLASRGGRLPAGPRRTQADVTTPGQ